MDVTVVQQLGRGKMRTSLTRPSSVRFELLLGEYEFALCSVSRKSKHARLLNEKLSNTGNRDGMTGFISDILAFQ